MPGPRLTESTRTTWHRSLGVPGRRARRVLVRARRSLNLPRSSTGAQIQILQPETRKWLRPV